MDYDLDTPTDSDTVLMSNGTLTLSGQQFSDFTFTALAGVEGGTYTLIDAGAINGTLGESFTGTIDGREASLAIQGNDLVLNVVPEPATAALLAVAAMALGGLRGKRRREERRTA